MLKLFMANLKMMFRGRQALFWSLFFPLIFTVIFGFFFGGSSTGAGTVALVNQSDTQIAKNLEKSLEDSKLFKLQKESDLDRAKTLLKSNKVAEVLEIPTGFGDLSSNSSKELLLINDPANAQANAVMTGFLSQYLTNVNYQIQNAKPIFTVKQETTTDASLTYFDFVLIGLIGMALMNGSVQGIAITMAKYREDKILKRITTTPLRPWKFVIAEVLARLIQNSAQIILIFAVGIFGFHAHIIGNIFFVGLLALLGGLLFQAIGFTVASFSKTTDAAQGLAVSVTIPMMFLAGVFFPTDQLPKWLFSIVQYLPLAPLLRMMRQVGLENSSPFGNYFNITIVLAWIALCLAISIWRFRLTDE